MTAPLSEGSLLDGKYQLTKLLHRGATCDTYRAEHVVLRNACVVKLLRAPATDHDVHAMINEGIVSKAARSRHIVAAEDVGKVGGVPYLIFDFLDGLTFSQMLTGGRRFDELTTLKILWQVLDALDAIHRQGIVHGNLGPQHIFLAPGTAVAPDVKLIDFSCAVRASDRDGPRRRPSLQPAPYLPDAPAEMERPTERSDLHAVGAVLFYALTGTWPYRNARVSDYIPTSPALDRVVSAATAPDLSGRFPSAIAFQHSLARAVLLG